MNEATENEAMKAALVEAARRQGMSVPEDVARMPAGGELTQVAPTQPVDAAQQFGNWLMKRLAPNARSLMVGEPEAPITDLPQTAGKVPSIEDPRPERAMIEGMQLAAPLPGPAIAGKMLGPALAGAEKLAPALAKAIPGQAMVNTGLAAGGVGSAVVPDPAQAAEGQPEEVPIGQRPQTGEWWRTRRAPPPEMPPFTPPTMLPDELAMFKDPEWKPPKGWQGDQEARQPNEGPVAHAKRVADLREQRALRETRKLSAGEAKTAVARKEYESERDRRMKEYEREQARLDKLDNEYKEANENFRRKHPALATALPIIGAGAGAALPYANRVRLQRINNKLVKDMDAAISRAEETAQKTVPAGLGKIEKSAAKKALTAEQAGAVTDLQGRMDPKAPLGLTRGRNVEPTAGAQAGAVGMGALGSIEGALLPYELDLALPIDSPDRKEAMNVLNWAERAGQQALPGGLAGHVGGHMPLPRRGLVPDIERAQGLVKQMTPVAPRAVPPKKSKSVVAKTTPESQVISIEQALGMK